MRITRTVALLGGLMLATMAAVPSTWAAGQADPDGLWGTGFSAQETDADCGLWALDSNGFCFANDARNGVELGVKFQTSQQVQITGVRIYRVDTAAVTGSLWSAGGTLLAHGKFSSGPGHAWQDMTFADPVTIVPGTTYVASYFSPGTKYAFRYGYFAQGLTEGPITALPSVADSPNGVHCYDDQQCDLFPVHGFRASTYWVTPLWQVPGAAVPTPQPTPTTVGGTTKVDRVAPRVLREFPAHRAVRVKVAVTVKVNFSKAIRRSTLNKTSVTLFRKGSSKAVSATLVYDAAHRRLVLRPRTALRHGTAYRVVVTTQVRDTVGNRFDQDRKKRGRQSATWTFRTR